MPNPSFKKPINPPIDLQKLSLVIIRVPKNGIVTKQQLSGGEVSLLIVKCKYQTIN